MIDPAIEAAARQRTSDLGIPYGSLGRLHDIAIWFASVQGSIKARADRCTTVVFCGDHGVAAQGVSSLPQYVTWTNMKYMAEGVATISIYAKLFNAGLCIVDIGVKGPKYVPPGNNGIDFVDCRVGEGTRDISREPAMTEDEVDQALQCGYDVTAGYAHATDIFLFGEMGIANTTSCSAIIGALFEEDPDRVTGLGSGITEEVRKHKSSVVAAAIERAMRDGPMTDPLVCLRQLGGYEIAGMVGGMIAAAAHRKPIILDGFISTTAFAIASKMVPGLSLAAVPGSYSAEYGYQVLARHLQLVPILNLGLRLGEGTGAILTWPIIRAAVEQLHHGVTREQLVLEFASRLD
jgi:nicotinate-nucleotide--dimethylbenzimidazole phosphoribosyltransferase